MASVLKETFQSQGFQLSDPLYSRGSDIAEAFAEAAEQHINDIRNPIFYSEIVRARLSISVDLDTPDISHPLSYYQAMGTDMEEADFYEEIQNYIDGYLSYHQQAYSSHAGTIISLRVDNKTPQMKVPTKTFEFILDAK